MARLSDAHERAMAAAIDQLEGRWLAAGGNPTDLRSGMGDRLREVLAWAKAYLETIVDEQPAHATVVTEEAAISSTESVAPAVAARVMTALVAAEPGGEFVEAAPEITAEECENRVEGVCLADECACEAVAEAAPPSDPESEREEG
jgi:hypothetical protein